MLSHSWAQPCPPPFKYKNRGVWCGETCSRGVGSNAVYSSSVQPSSPRPSKRWTDVSVTGVTSEQAGVLQVVREEPTVRERLAASLQRRLKFVSEAFSACSLCLWKELGELPGRSRVHPEPFFSYHEDASSPPSLPVIVEDNTVG